MRGKEDPISYETALRLLKQSSKPENIKGMSRFGINTKTALGVNVPTIRAIAKKVGRNQRASLRFWKTGIHEALMLAAFTGDPKQVTELQMEAWVKGFHSWDICDQVCGNLFDRTPMAYKTALVWSKRKEEYVKRAGFVLMATLCVHDKTLADEKFTPFLAEIKRESIDERNFVMKAVNWALRQIGKRNLALNRKAIACAKAVRNKGTRSCRWIASNALSELESKAVMDRLSVRKAILISKGSLT